MEIVYTVHSVIQMRERKVENVWVEETIKFPDETRKF